jgi:NHLM bacteriocin system ABC transporter ATP-binding protein
VLRETPLVNDDDVLIADKPRRDREAISALLEPLILDTTEPAGRSGVDPLIAAFRAVAAASHAKLGMDGEALTYDDGPQTLHERITHLACLAKFRVRRVHLARDWWRASGQPLLVFRASDGLPMAAIAHTGWRAGFDLQDPDGRRPIDDAEASNLAPIGYVLQRSLPERPINGAALIRFSAKLGRPLFAAAVLIGLVSSLLSLIMPIATEILFETVIPSSLHSELLQLVAGIAVIGLGGVAFDLVRGFVLIRLMTLLNTDLEGAIWDRLLRLPAKFFRDYSAGDLALRAAAINQMRDMLSGTALTTLMSSVFSVVSLGLLLYYDWRLALVAVALVLLQLAVMVLVNLRLIVWRRRGLETNGRLQSLGLQLIQAISKLKVGGGEARAFARWAELYIARRELDFRQHRISAGFEAFSATFSVASTFAIIATVGFDRINIGIGQFVAFNAAYGQFIAATLSLGSVLPVILSLLPLYERARPLLQAAPENNGSRALPGTLTGEIEISSAVFRYQSDGANVLNGLSIKARPGEFVAIVGPSGSGKSTLVRLLLGFETPASGSIFFDRQNLAGLDLQAVRRQLGVVLQSSRVMTGSIQENILCGAPLTEADAWEAARMAGFDEDIERMPMKMFTFVGEDGALLSGGQRQRLIIARAVVRQPRILIFDEATSALDNRSQQVVSERLQQLDATRIVIAHRLSTIAHADRIYVLDAGKIVEEGSYGELMKPGGLFAELSQRQTI